MIITLEEAEQLPIKSIVLVDDTIRTKYLLIRTEDAGWYAYTMHDGGLRLVLWARNIRRVGDVAWRGRPEYSLITNETIKKRLIKSLIRQGHTLTNRVTFDDTHTNHIRAHVDAETRGFVEYMREYMIPTTGTATTVTAPTNDQIIRWVLTNDE